jgi:hypothetical protein
MFSYDLPFLMEEEKLIDFFKIVTRDSISLNIPGMKTSYFANLLFFLKTIIMKKALLTEKT